MRIRILALLLAAIAALAPLPAKAKLMFGNDETIHFIQDVTATGAQGEKLYLVYKITKTFLFAGIWLQDDGYVLGVKGEGRRYYTMPKDDELKRLQAGGFLPNPLPVTGSELSSISSAIRSG
jgi:hypothetical protein